MRAVKSSCVRSASRLWSRLTGNTPARQRHSRKRSGSALNSIFKKRLDDKGIPYSDFGAWAMKGWEQVFFYDPAGNIIEVHQVHE